MLALRVIAGAATQQGAIRGHHLFHPTQQGARLVGVVEEGLLPAPPAPTPRHRRPTGRACRSRGPRAPRGRTSRTDRARRRSRRPHEGPRRSHGTECSRGRQGLARPGLDSWAQRSLAHHDQRHTRAPEHLAPFFGQTAGMLLRREPPHVERDGALRHAAPRAGGRVHGMACGMKKVQIDPQRYIGHVGHADALEVASRKVGGHDGAADRGGDAPGIPADDPRERAPRGRLPLLSRCDEAWQVGVIEPDRRRLVLPARAKGSMGAKYELPTSITSGRSCATMRLVDRVASMNRYAGLNGIAGPRSGNSAPRRIRRWRRAHRE